MKWLSLLFSLHYASTALAQELPEVTHAPQLIQARVEMTYWQNWAVGSGALLTGVAAMGALIQSVVSSMSSSDSCVTTIVIVSSTKRSLQIVEVDVVTAHLGAQGYASYGEWHLHDNGTQAFDGFFTNGEIRLEEFSVSGNYTTGRVSLENGTSSDLQKRTTWAHKKVEFEYHSRAGACKTRLTKAQLREGIDAQLTKMSNDKQRCSCWTYTGNHGWYGELKLMEIDDGDVIDGTCYAKTCNAD